MSKDQGERFDTSRADLVALVRPGGTTRVSLRESSVWDEIWDKVAHGGVEMPGNWDEGIAGAMAAARSGDWTLCTYLAARLFRERGGEALLEGRRRSPLEEEDEESRRQLWREVVDPVIVDVPPGSERLKVCLHGGPVEGEWVPTSFIQKQVSANGLVRVERRGRGTLVGGLEGAPEKFKVGAKLQVCGMKRLMLEPQDQEELRPFLELDAEDLALLDPDARPGFLGKHLRHSPMPGAWYQVLAYPFAGDLTKAMLRRVASSWTVAQHRTVWGLGETLLSQCAKAGAWGLVRTLVERASLELPDLSREFEGLFGNESLRRQWRKDLYASFGSDRAPSLVELAARDCNDAARPLPLIVKCLPPRQRRSVLGSSLSKQQPLIVAAALKARWDVVEQLLELDEEVEVCASSLLQAQFSAMVPERVAPLLAERARREQVTTVRAIALREYFIRLLLGEPSTEDMAPLEFRYGERGGVLEPRAGDSEGPRIVNRSLWLGSRDDSPPLSSWEVAFVRVEPGELEEVLQVIRRESRAAPLLPSAFDLGCTSRGVQLEEPAYGDWLAVCCPRGYYQPGPEGLPFSVPPNCISTPQVSQLVSVSVKVVTPCCWQPLSNVPVQINGKVFGRTDVKGVMLARLSPGNYVTGAPEHSGQTVPFQVDGHSGGQEVTIRSRGDVFVYVRDAGSGEDGEPRDGVYVCGDKPSNVVDFARSFSGAAMVDGRRYACSGSEVHVFRVKPNQACTQTLSTLDVQSFDGLDFERDEEYEPWCHRLQESRECALQMLTQVDHKLGLLLGGPAPPSALGTLAGSLRPSQLATTKRQWKPRYWDVLCSYVAENKECPSGDLCAYAHRVPREISHLTGSSGRSVAAARPRTSRRPSSATPATAVARMQKLAGHPSLRPESASRRPPRLQEPVPGSASAGSRPSTVRSGRHQGAESSVVSSALLRPVSAGSVGRQRRSSTKKFDSSLLEIWRSL